MRLLPLTCSPPALIAVALCLTAGTPSMERVSHTGTFSSMHDAQEGGDLLGAELKIVYTKRGYQGAFQAAEGVPSELFVVPINFAGDSIHFQIPKGEYAGTFTGALVRNTLQGRLRLAEGGEMKLSLRRGQSFWDGSHRRPRMIQSLGSIDNPACQRRHAAVARESVL